MKSFFWEEKIPVCIKCFLAEIMRPLMCLLPRGNYRLYNLVCGTRWEGDQAWAKARRRKRIFFDRTLQAYVYADLADWSGRRHYFTGRYRDMAGLLLTEQLLRPGDTYIDVGANYGVFSLLASRIVGDAGHVIAFEPNPGVCGILSALVAINGLSNCSVYNIGLSDCAAELTLSGASDHTGTFTCRKVEMPKRVMKVCVGRGDEILRDVGLSRRVLLKIDTEGFEHHVVRGFEGLLGRDGVAAFIEVTDVWLREVGSSAVKLFRHMEERGFIAYIARFRWHLFWRPALELTRITEPVDAEQQDVLFAKSSFLQG